MNGSLELPPICFVPTAIHKSLPEPFSPNAIELKTTVSLISESARVSQVNPSSDSLNLPEFPAPTHLESAYVIANIFSGSSTSAKTLPLLVPSL